MEQQQAQPDITWPERPTCHDKDFMAQRFDPPHWHPAGVRFHPDNDHVPAFRTCSYCGSIHPEDLLKAIEGGARLGGSDWKYGWPHKFYVHEIPNSQQGNLVTRMSGSGMLPLTDEEREKHQRFLKPGGKVEFTEDADRWRVRVLEPDGPTTHGKWYNVHLHDLSPEAFAKLATVLEQRAGIKFVLEGEKLTYWAPRSGYQR